jgi:hypothetical protein
MTTLSRSFESADARIRASRWAEWEAKGAAHDARLRNRAAGTFWLVVSAALFAAALFLSL